MPEEWYHTSK